MSVLSRPYFHCETAAFKHVEGIPWRNGAHCPHCGNMGKIYELKGVRSKPSKKNPEGVERHGLKKCGECRNQFTVRIGTIFEENHIPLHKWLQAIYLMCSSKKGHGYAHKHKVLALVNREGKARSMVVDDLEASTLTPILKDNIAAETRVITEEAGQYKKLSKEFEHDFVRHGQGEYGRDEIHTNTIEGYFSIFKRGLKGTYQHCAKRHLHRYLAEFNFRYNNRIKLGVDDKARATAALVGVVQKRLMYRDSSLA